MNEQEINSKKIVLGVDIGSITSKAVILSGIQLLSWAIIPSGGNLKAAASEIIEQVLAKARLSFTSIDYTVATGYGAANVTSANESVVDILSPVEVGTTVAVFSVWDLLPDRHPLTAAMIKIKSTIIILDVLM